MSFPCRSSLLTLILLTIGGLSLAHPGGHDDLSAGERYRHAVELAGDGRTVAAEQLMTELLQQRYGPALYRRYAALRDQTDEALAWLRRVSGPSSAAEQHRLGMIWLSGDGVQADAGLAAFWFREAAAQGHRSSQVLLAGMLDRGDGLKANPDEARRWLEQAARNGSAEAQYRLGLQLDDERGRAWISRAARAGHSRAQRWLGLQYARGGRYPMDESLALRWLERAAANGDPTAMLLAGMFHLEGRGTAEDEQAAYRWLKRADLAGEIRARPVVQRLEQSLDINERISTMTKAIDETLPDPVPLSRFDHQIPANQLLGYGSGFWISGDGLLMTNHHVVERCTELRVPGLGEAELIASEPGNDIALLQADARPEAWALFRTGTPAIGEPLSAWTVAHPDSDYERRDQHLGQVRALERPGFDGRYFRFDARLEQGSSGSPVFDGQGRIAGLVVAKLAPAAAYRATGVAGEPASFALKPELIRGFLEVYGRMPRPPERAGTPDDIVVRVECWY